MIEFYFDAACPQAWFACSVMEELLPGESFAFEPLLLADLAAAAGTTGREVPPARAALLERDVERWASFWGLPRRRTDVGEGRVAARAVWSAASEHRPALARTLMTGAHGEGHSLDDAEWVASVASSHGVQTKEASEADAGLAEQARKAAARGVFAVPTWLHDQRVFYGHDRLGLLRRALGHATDVTAWAAGKFEPSGAAAPPGIEVEFFHDFSSPFSYLASTAVQRVADRHGLPVRWTPILLGGLFRDIGTPEVPLFAMPAAEQAWGKKDMTDWAEALEVPFAFPSHFPMRSILPLRAALARPGLTPALYRAAWAEDRRIDTPQGLAAVVQECGESTQEVAAAVADPAIKAALRQNTERARALGACGVPTFAVIGPGRAPIVLWGQDRLVHLDAIGRGWAPPDRSDH